MAKPTCETHYISTSITHTPFIVAVVEMMKSNYILLRLFYGEMTYELLEEELTYKWHDFIGRYHLCSQIFSHHHLSIAKAVGKFR